MALAKTIFITIFLGHFKGPLGKYIHVQESQTWSVAQSHCQTHYSDLAVVNSQKDHDLLMAGENQDLTGWIGLHRDDVNVSLWRWSGEGKMRYQNWAKDQPNNKDGKQSVVQMWSDGKWNDISPGFDLTFYCIKLSVVKINMSWEEALEHCKTEQFTGLSCDKPILASNEMEKEEVSLVWIGLRFLGDQWQWVSGAPLESGSVSSPQPLCNVKLTGTV
ncbi:hypothetical protein NQD34_000964 [Periophthalmus magnuspinnatus]|nr:hypothetical protein NQD34_000964 [Periophthalmus magnuspinnatus]